MEFIGVLEFGWRSRRLWCTAVQRLPVSKSGKGVCKSLFSPGFVGVFAPSLP